MVVLGYHVSTHVFVHLWILSMHLIAKCMVCMHVYVVCPSCTANTDMAAPLLQLVDFVDAGHANPHADDPAGQGFWGGRRIPVL